MIKMRDGFDIRVKIYSPAEQTKSGVDEGRPLLVWYHGGGYCLGTPEAEEENCRVFSRDFGGVAVNVAYRYVCRDAEYRLMIGSNKYRLAPEWKFPTPINDAFDALEWVTGYLITSTILVA